MNYFQANNLSKTYAAKVLFENISFGIDQGQKVALIARNGAGKSTLLNIMTGSEIPDTGNCNFRKDIRVAYLKQNPSFTKGIRVIDTLFHNPGKKTSIIKQYYDQLDKNQHQPSADNIENLQRMIQRMDEAEAWDYELRYKQILSQLKIHNTSQKVEELSGGQIKRVALAKVLIDDADFLILDEPTNHLDIEMIEWLEGYLSRSKLTIFLVTHDRYFLDKTCNEILEVEYGNMHKYKGNYSYYLTKKQERQNAEKSETEKARNLLRKETEWMRRQPKARTTKSKARIDSYHELKETARSQTDETMKNISVKSVRLGKKILELNNITKQFDNKNKVIDNFSYTFKRYEKAGIVGMNGTGKSTLLNIITGKLKPDQGSVVTGETIQYGYYRQEGMKVDENKKVIDVIADISENIEMGNGKFFSAGEFLNFFRFPYQTQNDLVSKLSGGEKRRLYLMTVLMNNPNFLILDEPTNDLDIDTLNVLEDFLEDFPGCLLVVSHDRYFLDKIVDHVFVFGENGQIRDFPGNYTDYQYHYQKELKEHRKREKQKSLDKKRSLESGQTKVTAPKKLTYKEQKELDQLETDLQELESEKSIVLNKLNSGTLSPNDLQKESEKYSRITENIEEKEFRWLELSERV